MPFADVNGQRLHFEDSGPAGADDVIVFSHGLFMDHTMFEPQVAALRDRWRCITWDERAHGATETTLDPFSYWDSADDLWGLLDHLGVERAVLAGMSQGGYLSLRAALRSSERVRALVLIDTQSGTEDPANLDYYSQMIDIWANTPGGPPQDLLDIVGSIILGNDFADADTWMAKWREADIDRVRQAFNTLVSRENDVTPRLGEIASIPAIVFHGDGDLSIDLQAATNLAEGLNAELHVIEGAGHAANLSHPEPVNAALVPFLEGL